MKKEFKIIKTYQISQPVKNLFKEVKLVKKEGVILMKKLNDLKSKLQTLEKEAWAKFTIETNTFDKQNMRYEHEKEIIVEYEGDEEDDEN